VAGRIEEYAIVGDMQSVAMICMDGSVDWLCLPRFDSEACFAALLGTQDHRRRDRDVRGDAALRRRHLDPGN
jgi:GH15 family glucan-1,4-alpha-glucosidase